MSLCGKRLGCRLTTGRFGLVVGGRFSDETDRRGGVPGKLKWMVLGRKLQPSQDISTHPRHIHSWERFQMLELVHKSNFKS
jgi:hypothetical protein